MSVTQAVDVPTVHVLVAFPQVGMRQASGTLGYKPGNGRQSASTRYVIARYTHVRQSLERPIDVDGEGRC